MRHACQSLSGLTGGGKAFKICSAVPAELRGFAVQPALDFGLLQPLVVFFSGLFVTVAFGDALTLSAVCTPAERLEPFARPHELVVKLFEERPRAVPCAFDLQLRSAVSHVDQIANLELLWGQPQCLDRFVERINNGTQPVGHSRAAFCTRWLHACFYGFLNRVRNQLVVHLRLRRSSFFSAFLGGSTNLAFKCAGWRVCPAANRVRNSRELRFVEEVAEPNMHTDLVQQDAHTLACSDVVCKQIRTSCFWIDKTFCVRWDAACVPFFIGNKVFDGLVHRNFAHVSVFITNSAAQLAAQLVRGQTFGRRAT